MKPILENWNKFLDEQESPRNIDKVIQFLKAKGIEFEQKSSTVLVARSPDREQLQRQIEPELAAMGYEWQPNAPGAGFGRFAIVDRNLGSVYILMKPKGRRAAFAGADYERNVANLMQELLPGFSVETAGFGAGSDLAIANDGKELKLELKTSSGADFGQFKLKYDIVSQKWLPMRTKKYIENSDLYGGVFKQVLEPNLQNKIIKDPTASNYNKRGDEIVGLLRQAGTRNKKLELQQLWFNGKSDMKLEIAAGLVQNYYALKGDSLIQIQGRGVYALTPEAAAYFGIPELEDNITKSLVRFRIKPHSGPDGVHSFTAALKISLKRSEHNLEDQSFLDKIENYLTN